MKLILFGGAELRQGQFLPQLKLIEQVINGIKPRQVLHIPFARVVATEVEWGGDWFNKNIHLDNTLYLNANNEGDLEKADHPLIFISGGKDHINLLAKIRSIPGLLEFIKNAEYIIGESAGSMVMGTYLREGGEEKIIPGLDIIKSTIIEPHYTERNRQALLEREMKENNLSFGVGIDCVTAIMFNLDEFPEKYKKIGNGLVEIKTNK